MLIRVRTNVGLWRVEGLNDDGSSTPDDVLGGIRHVRPDVVYVRQLCSDPACVNELDRSKTLRQLGLRHGSMIHARVDPETCADSTAAAAAPSGDGGEAEGGGGVDRQKLPPPPPGRKNVRRVIGEDGTIKLVPIAGGGGESASTSDRGFRKGMLPLRDMKMRWTLQEFVDMNERFVFKIKRQEEKWVGSGGCSLDTPNANDFQGYLRRFDFRRNRFGLLYGKFVDEEEEEMDDEEKKRRKERGEDDSSPRNKKVVVEAIYEPPQESDPESAEGYVVLEDPNEDTVERVAGMLGLKRVGWIFGHPPREDGFQLSAAEIITAAEFQLESAGGVERTPFVTVKVTVGDDGNASFEAFQVSRQCMEMVAEEALEVGSDPGFCVVNDTFTALQEGKESRTVENNFFLTVVPIVQHASESFVSQFPRCNRDMDDRSQSRDEMRKQLSKAGGSGWTFLDLLADFHLLIYLCQFMDVNADMPRICDSVVNRDVPLDDGFKLIIASIAGMDGSY